MIHISPTMRGKEIMAHTTISKNSGLSLNELKEHCPSIFGAGPHASRSSKYVFVPTSDILEMLLDEDFIAVSASQTYSRTSIDDDFNKHMIRLRHKSDMNGSANGRAKLGGVVPEIILMNAHNGSSSFKILSGLFRFICLNGLIMGENMMGSAIRHMGEDTLDVVMETATKVLQNSIRAIDSAKVWQQIKLEKHARDTIAQMAHKLRFTSDSQINAEQLLEPRRAEDESHDLWTTYNVVQENILRGGLKGGGVCNGRWKQSRTSDISAVGKTVELNQKLWDICADVSTRSLLTA